MSRTTIFRLLVIACATATAPAARATDDPAYDPPIAAASAEGGRAIARFRVPEGFRVELVAAEPLVANPVAFTVDARGRLFVAETFRHHEGVTDTRGHMNWLDADLASRTVEDRVAMFREYLGDDFAGYGKAHDRVRRVEDRDGDGVFDHATVFADGFNNVPDGIGAGVLARGEHVWYTCIPSLWKLTDADDDGKAEAREPLSTGYGVHVGFLGHDLHGLKFGPDGKLYFSIGDRGLNVTAIDGRRATVIDTGSVLRCDPDGTNLEVFATGLRNPQELAFDAHGNLFTVDNNSDGGDKARLVYLVEGGDSGWRIGYQFLEAPVSRGPWGAEKLWQTVEGGNDAAYLLPPLAHLSDGPSGLTVNPGTGLPDRYRDHFFLADFRGTSGTSGIRAFSVKPKGAAFELDRSEEFLWSVLATDVEPAIGGGLLVSDWVEGWEKPNKGRIYRVFDPAVATQPVVTEVAGLLREGMAARPVDELGRLLQHADARIRQEAQFALAERGAVGKPTFVAATKGDHALARLHGIWGLGQIGRAEPSALAAVAPMLDHADPHARAQSAKVLGDARRVESLDPLIARLGDADANVRLQAALALGKLGRREAIGPVLAMARAAADADPYLRHAAVMALAGCSEPADLEAAAVDSSDAVRMAVLLAWRRQGRLEVARFLADADPRLALEAARAIYDVPIEGATDRLAGLAIVPGQDEALSRRIVQANARLGGAVGAGRLAAAAGRDDLASAIRVEALDALGAWAEPTELDRITGLWRPIAAQPVAEAAATLGPLFDKLLAAGTPGEVVEAAVAAVGRLNVAAAAPALVGILADGDRPVGVRVAAIEALERLGDTDRLGPALRDAVLDPSAEVRGAALTALAKLDPAVAMPVLETVLGQGTTPERQLAWSALGGMAAGPADDRLARGLDDLIAGSIAAEERLDLIEAARRREAPPVRDRLARFEASRPADDALAAYRDCLVGGDAGRGRRIFQERTELSCVRCHKIGGEGGEVGPDLSGIGAKHPREYLLESIVEPNRAIAEGFDTLVVATADGQVIAGIVKSDTGGTLGLMTAEGKLVDLPKDQIEEQTRGISAMPADLLAKLTKPELRDLVEFLSGLKSPSN